MLVSNLYVALVVGLVLSLIFTEISGIVPAGLVVPGYLALVFNQPITVILIFVISFLTYFVVTHVLSKHTILYGRRKFAAMVIVAIVFKLCLHWIHPVLYLGNYDLAGIGVVVPGLIASGFDRQGIASTIGSTLLLGGLTFITILIYQMF